MGALAGYSAAEPRSACDRVRQSLSSCWSSTGCRRHRQRPQACSRRAPCMLLSITDVCLRLNMVKSRYRSRHNQTYLPHVLQFHTLPRGLLISRSVIIRKCNRTCFDELVILITCNQLMELLLR